MRNLVSLLLVYLLAACPMFCEASESGPDSHQCSPEGKCGEHGVPAPGPCSGDGGNCICRGAVQFPEARLPNSDTPRPQLLDFTPLAPPLSHPVFLHSPQGGTSTGLAGIGDSGTIRALLQNDRC